MSFDAYIGYLDDPDFDFNATNWVGNIPNRASPFIHDGYKVLTKLWDMKKAGDEGVRQLDWGAWGKVFKKGKLTYFLLDFYQYGIPDNVFKFLEGLDPERDCVLVAYEY